MSSPKKRPVRIAGCSGSASDRRHIIPLLAANYAADPIDVIIGDWMSEANMTSRAASKANGASDAYEPTFLEAIVPALPSIAKYGIKIAVNAGACDTKALHAVLTSIIQEQGLDIKVAWISGDEVLPAIRSALSSGDPETDSKFENICTGESLSEWCKTFEPIGAQAYLGGLGIALAFSKGASIVLSGRVSDASLIIGAAAWYHRWDNLELDKLAIALVTGHLIECSNYICGGNFTGFKRLRNKGKGWQDIGYPIAEISDSGDVIITKNINSGGTITVDTCLSQLLYEIQGPWYFNSDVTAVLDSIHFEEIGPDRVALKGVKSALPPPTTKVGITARGGFQAEIHWFLVGLDIQEKASMIEDQIRHLLTPHIKNFTKLEFTLNGSPAPNSSNQNSATVDLRVLAQSLKAEYLAPDKFLRPCIDVIMQAYPGATPHLDIRTGFPREVYEYYVTLLPQSTIDHRVHMHDGTQYSVPPPTVDLLNGTAVYPKQQPSQPSTANPVDLSTFGPMTRGPLGWIVHARSGDKGSNCNVGFWIRHDSGTSKAMMEEEWNWLRTILSVEKVKELLGEEYNSKKIDRFEIPPSHAVHFLLYDHLDRGVSCSTTYDVLGKNVAEFLRARYVDIPTKFLARGKL